MNANNAKAIAYLRTTAQRRANQVNTRLDTEDQVLAFLDTVRGFNEDKKCGGSYIPNHYTCHVGQPATSAMQRTMRQRTRRPKLKQGSSKGEFNSGALFAIAGGAAAGVAVGVAAGYLIGAGRGYYTTEQGAKERIDEYKKQAEQATSKARQEIEREYNRQLEEAQARMAQEADDKFNAAVFDLETKYKGKTTTEVQKLSDQISELEANRQVEIANLEAEREEAVAKAIAETAGQEQAKAEKAIQAERDRIAAEQAKVQKQYAKQLAKLEAEKNAAIAKASAESQSRESLQVERTAMQREFTKQVTELDKAKNEAIDRASREVNEAAQKQILEERQRYADERAQLITEYEDKLLKANTPKSRNNKPGDMVMEPGKGPSLTASIIQGKIIATEDNPSVGQSKSNLERNVLDNTKNLKDAEYARIQKDLAEEFREQVKRIEQTQYPTTEARWRAIENTILIQNRRESLAYELLATDKSNKEAGSEWRQARADLARYVQDLDISNQEALRKSAESFDKKAQGRFLRMIQDVERQLSEAKQNEMRFDAIAILLDSGDVYRSALEHTFRRRVEQDSVEDRTSLQYWFQQRVRQDKGQGNCPPGKHWVDDDRAKGGGYCRKSQGSNTALAQTGQVAKERLQATAKTLSKPKNAALTAGGVQILGIAAVGGLVGKDIANNYTAEKKGRWTDDGMPDEEGLKAYDDMQPGDMIRKYFDTPFGYKEHYGVYVGKDPKTGEHMMVESGAMLYKGEGKKKAGRGAFIRYGGLAWDADPRASLYEKVPPEEINGGKGLDMSREEIVERAMQSVGQPFRYRLLSSNCEAAARGFVEGNAYTNQGDQYSRLSKFVGDTVVIDNIFRYLATGTGVKFRRQSADEIVQNLAEARGNYEAEKATRYYTASPQKMTEQEKRRRTRIQRDAMANKADLLLALQKQIRSDAADADHKVAKMRELIASIGLKQPEEYDAIVQKMAQDNPGTMNKNIQVQLYKNYLMVLLASINEMGSAGGKLSPAAT